MAESSSEASALVLQEYARVLRRRRWVVVGAVVLTVGCALAWSLSRPKVYRASAELLLQHRGTENLFDALKDIDDPSRLPSTEMKVIQSRPVRAKVEARLGSAPRVATRQSGSADVIEIRAEDSQPARAADIANAYAEAYIEYRRTQAVDNILAATKEIQTKVDQLQAEINALEVQARNAGNTSAAAAAVLASQSQALSSQQNVFKQTLNQLQVVTALNTGGAQIVDPATPPSEPFSPRPLSNAILAGAFGLLVGVGLAFLLEYFDDSVKTKDHLERAVGAGVPVFGLIPRIERADREGGQEAALVTPSSPPAEAYRALRTSVQFLGVDRPQVLQVTSASLSEGKTTTIVNLAAVFARAGKRVILADCDLRRPRVHQFFGLSNETGFTSVLLGEVSLASAVHRVPAAGDFLILPSGPRPPNPSELLSSRRTHDLLKSLKAAADIVLIDSPPLLPVTDASVLAGRVDGVLLVVMAGTTTRRPLHRAVELLQQMQAPLVGTVLTRFGGDLEHGYDYPYYYGADQPVRRWGRRRGQRANGLSGAASPDERVVS